MAAFGTAGWVDEGWVRIARGPRRLLKARVTSRFRAAWDTAQRLLDAVGFDGSSQEFIRY